jgi:hypothetical protein
MWLPALAGRLPYRAQLPPAFPDTGHRPAKFFIGDVQVPLRLLDVGVPEHQLNRANVHSVAQEAAGPFVTEVMPVQVDLAQLGAIDAGTGFRARDVVAVREQQQGFPRCLEVLDVLATGRAEHERAWAERRAALEDRRQTSLWFEGTRRFSESFACRPGMAIW